MKSLFIELLVVNKKEGNLKYDVNVSNINYFRKWVGIKGELQTCVFFNGDKKYLVIDESIETVRDKIKKATQSA
jgi:hypothetical protein